MRRDEAHRVFELAGWVPEILEYTRGSGAQVIMRPYEARMRWVNGELHEVVLVGHRLNSKGLPSRVEGTVRWSGREIERGETPAFGRNRHTPPPAWLLALVTEAKEPTVKEARDSDGI